MAPSQLFHGCMTTFGTHADIEVPDCFQKLCHGHTGKPLSETQSSLNLADDFQVMGFHTVIQETIVADFLITCRQYVHEVTPYEFRTGQGYPALWISRLLPSGRERDILPVKVKNTAVRDGNLMGIASKVFDGIAKAVKGFLDIRAPVHFIELIFQFLPVTGISKSFAGG